MSQLSSGYNQLPQMGHFFLPSFFTYMKPHVKKTENSGPKRGPFELLDVKS